MAQMLLLLDNRYDSDEKADNTIYSMLAPPPWTPNINKLYYYYQHYDSSQVKTRQRSQNWAHDLWTENCLQKSSSRLTAAEFSRIEDGKC